MTSPLMGKSVVVTRALHQADELNALLRERGAVPLAYPCIAIVPPLDTTALDNALQEMLVGAYDWLIFTSSNSVRMVAERLKERLYEADTHKRVPTNHPISVGTPFLASARSLPKIAAIGEATAQAVSEYLGVSATLVPQDYNAQSIADALASTLPRGVRVLLPQSEIADVKLQRQLSTSGAVVTSVTAYRTVMGSGGVDVPALLDRGHIDAITFTSPSTVENFMRRLTVTPPQPLPEYRDGLSDGFPPHVRGEGLTQDSICIACIGTTTAKAAERLKFKVSVIPAQATLRALCESLEQYFERL